MDVPVLVFRRRRPHAWATTRRCWVMLGFDAEGCETRGGLTMRRRAMRIYGQSGPYRKQLCVAKWRQVRVRPARPTLGRLQNTSTHSGPLPSDALAAGRLATGHFTGHRPTRLPAPLAWLRPASGTATAPPSESRSETSGARAVLLCQNTVERRSTEEYTSWKSSRSRGDTK